MITPVPQIPAPRLPAVPEPREKGEAFVRVLSANRQAPLAGDVPVREHGPAIVAVADMVARESAAVTDPAPSDGKDAEKAPVAAERFNENGFFGAATGGIATQPTMAEASAPPPVQPLRDIPRMTGDPVAMAGDMDVPVGALASAVATPSPLAAPALPCAVTATPGAGVVLASTPVRIVREGADEAVRAPAPRAQIRWPQPRAAVQVVVSELEQGIHVAARADALDEGERARLHDEIAALLARHGRAARTISIHAPAPPFQEKAR